MRLENLSVDEDDERFQAKLEECDLSDETADAFLFLKAQTEEILGKNGYVSRLLQEGSVLWKLHRFTTGE